MTLSAHISIPEAEIVEFCQRWRIKELAIFGSVLRDDFRPDSDVDVLVVFHEDAPRSLSAYFKAEEELEQIVGRKVDLVEKSAIRNPFRRHHILSNRALLVDLVEVGEGCNADGWRSFYPGPVVVGWAALQG